MIRWAHGRGVRRPGKVVVMVAVSLVAILGFIALSIDGGVLMDKRRQAQCTADSAALAAASELYSNWMVNGPAFQGLDPYGTAATAARSTAAANGYTDGQAGCTVAVSIPPTSGQFAGTVGYVEVVVTHRQRRYFSRLFGSEDVEYTARAVARGRRSIIENAIIILDPSSKGALSSGGNGSVTVQGAPIQVNSYHAEAMIANGGGSMQATQFRVAGSPGWSTPGGGSFTGPIVSRADPISDPLAYLPYPDPSTLQVRSKSKDTYSGNRTVTLRPGIYEGGISITGGTINLEPGIYYMKGGGFTLGGQGNLYGSGVMIFNDPESNSDVISIAGGGNCVLSPPTSGPYQGVLLFQRRDSTAPVSVSGSAGAILSITGTFYAASALLNVTGNGTQQTIGSQYISWGLALGGNGSYFCSWTAKDTPGVRELRLVE